MDKSRWPRAGTAGPVQLCRPGRSRSCMDPDTPMGIEYRLSVRPHFRWWDAYAEFLTSTSASRLPGLPILSFDHMFGSCKACIDPVSCADDY